MGIRKVVDDVYGSIAELVNVSWYVKLAYQALLCWLYIEIGLFVLEDPWSPTKLIFGIVAAVNLAFIIRYDLQWQTQKGVIRR